MCLLTQALSESVSSASCPARPAQTPSIGFRPSWRDGAHPDGRRPRGARRSPLAVIPRPRRAAASRPEGDFNRGQAALRRASAATCHALRDAGSTADDRARTSTPPSRRRAPSAWTRTRSPASSRPRSTTRGRPDRPTRRLDAGRPGQRRRPRRRRELRRRGRRQPRVQGAAAAGPARRPGVRRRTAAASCHTLQAAGRTGTTGPDLDKAIAGQGRLKTPAEIKQSIVDPTSKITPGYPAGRDAADLRPDDHADRT